MKIRGCPHRKIENKDSKLGVYSYDFHDKMQCQFCHPHPSILFPRLFEELSLQLLEGKKRRAYVVNQNSFLIIPAYTKVLITSISESSAFTLLFPTFELYKKLLHHCKLSEQDFYNIFEYSSLVRRKNWLNELVLRYDFEMVETSNRHNYVVRFLELEIMKEIYFNYCEEKDPVYHLQFTPSWHTIRQNDPMMQKVLIYIENHLLQKLTVEKMAKDLSISQASLLRMFKHNLKKTTEGYIQTRKLQKAKFLIRSGQYNISQTADMLGYNSMSAFTKAFKKQFSVLPSRINTISDYPVFQKS